MGTQARGANDETPSARAIRKKENKSERGALINREKEEERKEKSSQRQYRPLTSGSDSRRGRERSSDVGVGTLGKPDTPPPTQGGQKRG